MPHGGKVERWSMVYFTASSSIHKRPRRTDWVNNNLRQLGIQYTGRQHKDTTRPSRSTSPFSCQEWNKEKTKLLAGHYMVTTSPLFYGRLKMLISCSLQPAARHTFDISTKRPYRNWTASNHSQRNARISFQHSSRKYHSRSKGLLTLRGNISHSRGTAESYQVGFARL